MQQVCVASVTSNLRSMLRVRWLCKHVPAQRACHVVVCFTVLGGTVRAHICYIGPLPRLCSRVHVQVVRGSASIKALMRTLKEAEIYKVSLGSWQYQLVMRCRAFKPGSGGAGCSTCLPEAVCATGRSHKLVCLRRDWVTTGMLLSPL